MPQVTVFTGCFLRLALIALLVGCSSNTGVSQMPMQNSVRTPFSLQQSRVDKPYSILHKFGVAPGDGTQPAAELINVNGILYGTTKTGGASNIGTVFTITPSGTETVIHSFGADGAYPVTALLYVDGTFYGTTSAGGLLGGGTIFSMTPAGKVKVLHKFTADYPGQKNTGSVPEGALIDVNGTLYGTTSQGGRHSCNDGYTGCGTVFNITTSGQYKLLYSFGKGARDGNFPVAALLNVDGALYGTTSEGGNHAFDGTVFSITPAGQYQSVYSFGTNPNDGDQPTAPLVEVNGTLYGTTSGGNSGSGNVFSITPSGTETNLHSFGSIDGSNPLAGLIGVNDVLYGTTATGGKNNFGTVFSITTDGTEKVLHSFGNATGKNPIASLLDLNGTLYGTTYGVLARPHGNVFSLAR
jgi:uncharacterized repeat protein (TIGR03803 family)